MDDSRRVARGADSALPALRKAAPPPALCGFLLLLAVVFAVSHAAGAAVGPVAPGMHTTAPGGAEDGGPPPGTGHGHGGRD
ncbi:hypothetical protein ACIOWI_31795 [Streptomyces sp. NPDC087659]|uniref:hypothetical protein n=1 Tax=unclassified Streptomyces TaxID=2593676 RepID=UPI003696FEA2